MSGSNNEVALDIYFRGSSSGEGAALDVGHIKRYPESFLGSGIITKLNLDTAMWIFQK